MQQLTEALSKDGALNNYRTLGKSVALHSDAGCVVQDWHVDFNPLCKSREFRGRRESVFGISWLQRCPWEYSGQ